MMTGQIYTGKTVAEALDTALRDLGKTTKEIEYTIVSQASKGIFGLFGKPAKIKVTVKPPASKENVRAVSESITDSKESLVSASAAEASSADSEGDARLDIAEKFLADVFAAMNIEVKILRTTSSEGEVYNLVGENLGILIGKHGQTLDALQYLANLAANRDTVDKNIPRVKIILDIENYRLRREETLTRLAGHLAEKACRMDREVHLEPMNRHERKVIHMALQDNRRVATFSAGEEPRRYVVIAPKKTRRIVRDNDEFL